MTTKPTKQKAADIEAEFRRLFWLARNAHRRLNKQTTADDPDHKSAMAFGTKHEWRWAESLLEASRLTYADAQDKALELLAKCKASMPAQWRGLWHFVLGSAFYAKGKHDEASKAFRKALEDPRFDPAAHGWTNLGLVLHAKGEHDEAIKAFRKALEDSKLERPGLTWVSLGITLAAKGEYDEAIKAYRKALDDPIYENPGNAWNNLGNALQAKGEYDEAIKAYRKALDDPKYETSGKAWYNLGNALLAKDEHDDAIKAYRKALDDPTNETPGNAWNNLGIVFHAKGENDEAIKAHRKALKDPKYQTPGKAWNNLGVALHAKGKHDAAIKAYRKALDDPTNEMPVRVWTNLAQTYVLAGKQDLAEEAFNKALGSPDPKGSDHARARLGLQLLKSKIETEALSPDDRAMAGKTVSGTPVVEIESGVIAAIQEAGDTQYEKYIARQESQRNNTLSILRGWSSAVTLLEGSERRWRGGGYFLKWRGYGIVIDPGFDFLRNFHDAGYHGREIHAVVVSHNHPDHNSDLKAVDDLRYELFKRPPTTGKPGSKPLVLLWDQDTDGATTFGIEKPMHHHEPVVLACGFPQPIDLRNHAAKIPVRVIPFKVNHGVDVPHAMGMVVELLDSKNKSAVRIGYTADTAYFEDLHKHLAGCDVVIAHISQPSIKELQDASELKEIHLGYRGTARLLKECKPKLALIGEFWAGFTDLRISLVKGLRQRSGVDAILPAGLAMHLKLPSLDIECTECAKPTPFSEIKVAPPPDNFGSLAYLCSNCMIG